MELLPQNLRFRCFHRLRCASHPEQSRLPTENRRQSPSRRPNLSCRKKEDDLNNVGSNVEQSVKEIKDNRYNNLSVNANDNNVLNISKDGEEDRITV